MEHYGTSMREDMLTLFNRTASILSMECSVVLHGASMLSNEAKYRAACILEIVTGQSPVGGTCEVSKEDPLRKIISDEQQRELDKVRGAALRQSLQAGQKKGQHKKTAQPQLTVDDLRKLGNGFKLKSMLEGVKMFDFLEKCREFYLPDVVGKTDGLKAGEILPSQGHPNHLRHAHVLGHFEAYTPSKQYRKSLRPADNPTELVTSYLLKSTDLLKFPDVELHFESMGSLVSKDSGDDTLHLILRPAVKVEPPLIPGVETLEISAGQQVDNAKVMNYALSQYFNMYMRRPRVSGPF